MKELKIPASIENLLTVLEFVVSELGGQPSKFVTQIQVVAEEIFVNIASYAYGEGTGDVVIRVTVDDNRRFVAEFEDNGKCYNPLDNADPDITLPPEERKIGGLGIFMVKNMMDSVDYQRVGNKNILTVKKHLEALTF